MAIGDILTKLVEDTISIIHILLSAESSNLKGIHFASFKVLLDCMGLPRLGGTST